MWGLLVVGMAIWVGRRKVVECAVAGMAAVIGRAKRYRRHHAHMLANLVDTPVVGAYDGDKNLSTQLQAYICISPVIRCAELAAWLDTAKFTVVLLAEGQIVECDVDLAAGQYTALNATYPIPYSIVDFDDLVAAHLHAKIAPEPDSDQLAE